FGVGGQLPVAFQGGVRGPAGSPPIRGWTVSFTFADGPRVDHVWGATISTSGASVIARNADYNGNLAAGGSTTFGFLGSWHGTNSVPAVTCTAR
ncbi:MAG: beta-mannosidase, partial [Actinobacteria bacterium]